MALGMSPGKAAAYGQGAVAGDVDPDPSVGVGPGEGPSNNNQTLSKIGKWAKGLLSGTTPEDQKTVSDDQNFNQLTPSQKANLVQKGYTISKSGNTVYSKTTPSAREFAENAFTGIDPDVAFRGAVAGINPETGTMFSGATKGSALDQFTNSMMTPQRADQNASRAKAYAAQSARMKSLGSGKRTGKKGVLGFLDLDKDGNIFTSTDPYGTVYGMSNKAIYDPSIQNPAYRGIPATYAAKTGGSFPQKTSEDRMLANQVMSYVMPGAGIARLGNYVRGKLSPKQQAQEETVTNKGMTDTQLTNFLGGLSFNQSDFVNLPEEEKNKFMSSTSPYVNGVTTIPLGEYNPVVGYREDESPVYAQDPDAAQYRGVGM